MVTGREILIDVARLLAKLFGWIFILPLALLLLLRFVAEDRLWPVGMWVNFAPFCFAPVIPLLLLALLGRAWRLVAVTLAVLVAGLIWFAPLLFNRPLVAPAGEGVTPLRIISFIPFRFNPQFEGLRQWATEEQADVILIQDFRLMNGRALVERAQADYPYASWKVQDWRPNSGNLILSRYPIVEQAVVVNADFVLKTFVSRVVLDVNGQRVALYNVNLMPSYDQERPRFTFRPMNWELNNFVLGYNPAGRNAGIDRLLEVLERETLPYIVAGQFGFSPLHRAYERLSSVMTDSQREAGYFMALTWPVGEVTGMLPAAITPMAQFDYVWHSRGDFQAAASFYGPVQGSDHLPLVTDLRLLPADPPN